MQVKNITLYFMQMYKKAVDKGHNCIYITFIFIFLKSHKMLIIFYFFLLCCLPVTSVFQHWRKRENILKENLFKNQTLSIFNSFLLLFVSSKIESKFNNSHYIIGQFVFLICSKKKAQQVLNLHAYVPPCVIVSQNDRKLSQKFDFKPISTRAYSPYRTILSVNHNEFGIEQGGIQPRAITCIFITIFFYLAIHF